MLERAARHVAFGFSLLLFGMIGPAAASGTNLAPAVAAAQPGRDGPALQRVPYPTPAPVPVAPMRLLIPSLALDAEVEALGVDAKGRMDTPHKLWDVGWFQPGPAPGSPGDAVIDGHVGLPGYPLIFSTLGRLRAGAELIVVHADGVRSHFTVSAVGSWPADSHPTGLFATGGPARLSLITCTGPYDRSNQTYADRLIVEATYTGSD